MKRIRLLFERVGDPYDERGQLGVVFLIVLAVLLFTLGVMILVAIGNAILSWAVVFTVLFGALSVMFWKATS